MLKPLRNFDSPAADLIRPMSYVEMQSLFDGAYPPGRLHYWKANFLPSLKDNAIETLVEHAGTRPSPLSALVVQQMHSAASRVGAGETAFVHRRDQYDLLIVAQWFNPRDSEKNVRWAREAWEKMQPFVERSVYVNDLGEEGEDRVSAAYGQNYERLVRLKNKYDPTNFFNMDQNIKPRLAATMKR